MDVFFISAKTPCNLPELVGHWEILKVKAKSSMKELLDLPALRVKAHPWESMIFLKGPSWGLPSLPLYMGREQPYGIRRVKGASFPDILSRHIRQTKFPSWSRHDSRELT